MANHIVRIAMLNTDLPVPNVFSRHGTYGNIFHDLLTKAALRIAPDITIISVDYDVRKGEFPITLHDVDVLLVTGSANSAYDNLKWIHELEAYILDVYLNHPRVKMFGSCFGHQIIGQSLLKPYGVFVEKDPHGWELGVRSIELTPTFLSALKSAPRKPSSFRFQDIPRLMRLQMVHADHVKIPSPELVPKSWAIVGRTEHCQVQGLYQSGRVLTLQGHFEFDRFVNSETLKVFGASWDPAVLKETLVAIDADDDALAAAEVVVQFLIEDAFSKITRTSDIVGGLVTPP